MRARVFALCFCRTMHEVWQTVLEETDRVGKVRLLAADTYLLQISEPCKPVRAAKSQVAKKVLNCVSFAFQRTVYSFFNVWKGDLAAVFKSFSYFIDCSRLFGLFRRV